MESAAFVLDIDECLELVPPDRGWTRFVAGHDVHPEDAFVAVVLHALGDSGSTSDTLAEFAQCAAQGVLDELGLASGATRADVDAIMGRCLTLSMQRRFPRSVRDRVARSLVIASRRGGEVTPLEHASRAEARESGVARRGGCHAAAA